MQKTQVSLYIAINSDGDYSIGLDYIDTPTPASTTMAIAACDASN